ncbi:hypothetical protein [Lysobacter sp. D1-1-M9]|uniref:hypothetical protein n=1 Tax=Novilysobacter longmucuonensis TaxID=3098603 RepID=UPI002FCBDCF9
MDRRSALHRYACQIGLLLAALALSAHAGQVRRSATMSVGLTVTAADPEASRGSAVEQRKGAATTKPARVDRPGGAAARDVPAKGGDRAAPVREPEPRGPRI